MVDNERSMEEDLVQGDHDLDNELDLDAEETEDLEAAMREALEAVEKAQSRAESGDEIVPPRPATSRPASARPRADVDIDKLEEEVAELRDRSTRTLADFENFRKRVEREKQEDRRYAAFDILREFLAVVDNLERALAAEGTSDDLKVGVELIHRQMKDMMKNAGVERISAEGEEFDPRFHEAVTHHEDATKSVPTVSDELQAGYLMHDRLLRPSVVKVAMPPNGDKEADSDV